MSRTDLTPGQWEKLEPLLPQNPEHGHAYEPHLPIINGILWRLKTGAPGRDVPERYGPRETCFLAGTDPQQGPGRWDRFTRTSRDGTWKRVLVALQVAEDAQGNIGWDGASLDSTSCKAHRSAGGQASSSGQAWSTGDQACPAVKRGQPRCSDQEGALLWSRTLL